MTQDSNSQKPSRRLSRRRILIGGASVASVAATVAAGYAQANTQKPPAPATGTANSQGRFANKVVLITGATSGIGEGTAYAFAREGAKVFFCGRRENLGRQVEANIKQFGSEATYMRADVRREQDVQALVNACAQKYGRIDIAFNNAGIVNPKIARLHDQSIEDFMDSINTNALGTFLSMKYEIPYMLKQKAGIIVNTASISAHKGFTEIGPYSTSKHAVLALTKVAALEYAKDNIRIVSISPGGVDTPMLRRVREQRGLSFEEGSKAIPIGRTNTVEEMARTVMFLASDDATAFHGSLIDVTSGMLD
ncbi:SDR family NAD(P)-dependent oxidoreductase [Leptolyngbya sp. NIES-2104]|uniref:SDR family NAD(P)-dependent oxidoreductase n=1 Tax=Leptolyngbya sp. NIES-2104 TaxID=1552121 RepID=UPI0006EC96B3|nr:SDR family oxidoreductase [Leptolyngbya sp. NIES-2104]GAP98047.1 3-oxoacyl-[acyl-carrier protein] reductase [Leptolyngbya sp. NIES-2104]